MTRKSVPSLYSAISYPLEDQNFSQPVLEDRSEQTDNQLSVTLYRIQVILGVLSHILLHFTITFSFICWLLCPHYNVGSMMTRSFSSLLIIQCNNSWDSINICWNNYWMGFDCYRICQCMNQVSKKASEWSISQCIKSTTNNTCTFQ